MCHFITLIVPDADPAAVATVVKRHGRSTKPITNPSLGKVLRPGERQYMAFGASCDCGTVLGRKPDTDAVVIKATDEVARLRRKGWSEGRIARALQDKARADSRPKHPGPDSFDLWAAILDDLAKDLKLPHAGLFVHSYSGDQSTDVFTAVRRETPKGQAPHDALGSMIEDEVLVFRFKA